MVYICKKNYDLKEYYRICVRDLFNLSIGKYNKMIFPLRIIREEFPDEYLKAIERKIEKKKHFSIIRRNKNKNINRNKIFINN